MNVEVLIYAYLAVCAAMIGFNIVCIFVFRHKDKKLDRRSRKYTEQICEIIQTDAKGVDERHRDTLRKTLRNPAGLMAFDQTLEKLYAEHPHEVAAYLSDIMPILAELEEVYRGKEVVEAAYFPYIIQKYKLFQGESIPAVTEMLLELVANSSLYCRENALQALYAVGSAQDVINGLTILDRSGHYHHPKLITDGLIKFSGSRRQLDEQLWAKLSLFSDGMQLAILDYFRFSSDAHCVPMLRLMLSSAKRDEVVYSCLRYFGKYPYEAAYPYLLDAAERATEDRWEYAAIAASSLAGYPGDRTVEALKNLLSSRNWHVRYNAAQSLTSLGLQYTDLADIFEGSDRYAAEMLRYRFDQRNMREKEVTTT